MWLLKDRDGKVKYLRPGKTIHFGRKQADIVLGNDSSISRTHATITVTLKDQIRTSEVSSTCIIKDANSKYGTYVIRNDVQLKPSNEGFELEPSDKIRIGLQNHIFTVEYIRFVTVISRLSTDHKKKLKDIMDKIGGIVIDYYDNNCTHLTATTATSTNKIISGLIAGVPIIDINYWIAVVKAIETDQNLPDTDLFTLPLQDKGINTQRVSLKPNPSRKILFEGKTFIFFSDKTYKEYKKMIRDAGGKVELRFVNLENISEDLFADNSIVMQMTDDNITDDLAVFNTMLYDKMQEKKLRMIAETEIPLAIVYVSLDQYCNPKYDFKELIKRKSLKEDTSKILALDTQDILMSATENIDANMRKVTSRQVCIPETIEFLQEDFPQDESSTNKNKLSTKIDNSTKTKFIMKTEGSSSEIDIQKHDQSVINLTNINLNKDKIDKVNDSKIDDKFSAMKKPELINENFGKKDFEDKDINEKTSLGLESKQMKLEIKMTNESATADSVISDNLNSLTKEQQSNLPTKNLSNTLCESVDKGKKRQREKSDDNINRNMQSNWKCKERINPIVVHKKRRSSATVSENNDDFAELEKQKNQIKTKEINKLEKWGFKKSEKKTIDFDLDDFDEMDELDKECKIDALKHLPGTSQEAIRSLKKVNQLKTSFKLSEDNEVDVNTLTKTFSITNIKLSKENIEDYTSIKSTKNKDDLKNNTSVKNKINNSYLIRPNIKAEPNVNLKDSKAFKKVYNQIPVNRIALSDMSVWKPNT